MPLSLLKTLVSAAYGGADIAVDYYNPTTAPSGSFAGPLDWERVVVPIAGGVLTALTKSGSTMGAIGEALELASIPLAEKSIANYFLSKSTLTFRANPGAGRGFGRGQITVRRPSTSPSAPGGIPGVIY